MVKRLFTFSIMVTLISVISCGVKDRYECVCTVNNTKIPVQVNNKSRSETEALCGEAERSYKNSDPNAHCEVK